MSQLSPDHVLVRNDRLSWRVLEGEAVILFPEAGSLHRLNPTGTRVWEHLDGERSLANIGSLLTEEFEVELAEALDEVQTLASQLLDAGLAEVRA